LFRFVLFTFAIHCHCAYNFWSSCFRVCCILRLFSIRK